MITSVSVSAVSEGKRSVKSRHDRAPLIRKVPGVVGNAIGTAALIYGYMNYKNTQLLAVEQARRILLTDAVFHQRERAGVFYVKHGGKARADKDFDLIRAADLKHWFTTVNKHQWVKSEGKVGNGMVYFDFDRDAGVANIQLKSGELNSLSVRYMP